VVDVGAQRQRGGVLVATEDDRDAGSPDQRRLLGVKTLEELVERSLLGDGGCPVRRGTSVTAIRV
jgi:hypothetical protein